MDLPDTARHSFIVRIWLERTAEEAGEARWHGSIVHVPSGDGRTFDDLDTVADFIGLYLADMGAVIKPKHQRPDLSDSSSEQEPGPT
jgi:hypothetical protein